MDVTENERRGAAQAALGCWRCDKVSSGRVRGRRCCVVRRLRFGLLGGLIRSRRRRRGVQLAAAVDAACACLHVCARVDVGGSRLAAAAVTLRALLAIPLCIAHDGRVRATLGFLPDA